MPENRPLISHLALVDPSARIGTGTRVGPFAVVEGEVEIGRDCAIGAHAVVKSHTRMGDRNQIHEGAVLGGPPQDLKWAASESDLVIGDENVIRENATLHRACEPGAATRVGSRNFLMANVHIAHDCLVEDGVIIANNVCLAGHVRIESGAFISGGVVIHQFCQIGRQSMTGGNAKVVQDVLPYLLVDGAPAKTRSLNLVGLRRGGFSAPERRALKQAYRVLFGSHRGLEEKLFELGRIDSDCVRHLIDFIGRSQRGYSGTE